MLDVIFRFDKIIVKKLRYSIFLFSYLTELLPMLKKSKASQWKRKNAVFPFILANLVFLSVTKLYPHWYIMCIYRLRRRCVNVCMNGWMSGNIVKRFGWPLVTKNALYKCSPFTILPFSIALLGSNFTAKRRWIETIVIAPSWPLCVNMSIRAIYVILRQLSCDPENPPRAGWIQRPYSWSKDTTPPGGRWSSRKR